MEFTLNYEATSSGDHLVYHTHQQYEIYIFLEGKCTFQIENLFYELQAGDILLIDGKQIHKAFVDGNYHTYKRTVIEFTEDYIAPVIEALKINHIFKLFEAKQGHLFRIKDAETRQKINQLIAEMHDLISDKKARYIDEQLKLLLAQVLMKIDAKVHAHLPNHIYSNEKILIVEEIYRCIAVRYAEDLSLDDIAEDLNLSKSYLSHLFKEITGTTIMNFLMGYRLTQAQYSLKVRTDLNISQIAELTGFESNAHFSRFFKKHLGLSPSDYRKLQIEYSQKFSQDRIMY